MTTFNLFFTLNISHIPLPQLAPQDRLDLAGPWTPCRLCLPARNNTILLLFLTNNPLKHQLRVELHLHISCENGPVTLSPGEPLPGAPSGPLGPGNPMSPCGHVTRVSDTTDWWEMLEIHREETGSDFTFCPGAPSSPGWPVIPGNPSDPGSPWAENNTQEHQRAADGLRVNQENKKLCDTSMNKRVN